MCDEFPELPALNLISEQPPTLAEPVAIPANQLGPNGIIRVTCVWSYTNSANSKTLGVEYGATGAGTGGTVFQAVVIAAATSSAFRTQVQIHNAGSVSSQKGYTTTNGGWTATTGTVPTTGAINTANASEIAICGTLANTGETITLESYCVEVCYGA